MLLSCIDSICFFQNPVLEVIQGLDLFKLYCPSSIIEEARQNRGIPNDLAFELFLRNQLSKAYLQFPTLRDGVVERGDKLIPAYKGYRYQMFFMTLPPTILRLLPKNYNQ